MAEATEVSGSSAPLTELPFPPCTRSHILNCSFHSWHPKYKAITPKARLIPLTEPFLDYLRADGIVLPADENEDQNDWSDADSGIFSGNDDGRDDDPDDEQEDPATRWRAIHDSVRATIEELGGKVVPKLNWSAPKDATWINATNSMECRSPNDVYLMLKSSDFVTHDLEHAFDDCAEDEESGRTQPTDTSVPYHLVLRKYFQLNPSLEFRCFVRRKRLIALCQRDLNHFDFLFQMRDKLRDTIHDFFDAKLKESFPDDSFVFDVYVPPPHNKVWLIDINPWAQRTDPLLFSWLELLTLPEPPAEKVATTVSLPIRPGGTSSEPVEDKADSTPLDEDESEASDVEEEIFIPEFRLIKRDDPEAYGFSTPQYSAHKLPKDVVDASRGGEGGLREFATQWKEVLAQAQARDAEDSAEE